MVEIGVYWFGYQYQQIFVIHHLLLEYRLNIHIGTAQWMIVWGTAQWMIVWGTAQ